MFTKIWNFLFGRSVNFAELTQKGAQIIDVRSASEFEGGHIAGSANIPLHTLEANLGKLRKDRPVITCCASGMRSLSAKNVLAKRGFEVYNGGGWASLERKIQ